MKKIKEKLIHWLGGYTAEEYEQESEESFEIGYVVMNVGIKKFADSLYGLPADEWCKKMYEFIETEFEVSKTSITDGSRADQETV